jgi:hypothetical protein
MPDKPPLNPLSVNDAMALVVEAATELGSPPGFVERLKLVTLLKHLYEKKNAILVVREQ